MGVAETLLSPSAKAPCFMHPEGQGGVPPKSSDLFVFQFWPATVTIDYSPNYAEKQIPGASHPLYQWISGGGRSITFQAQFVAEIDEVVQGALAITAGALPAPAANAAIPSGRYTVDVGAALARLHSYMMPSYGGSGANAGLAVAPPRMRLYFPGMDLGGGSPNRGYADVLTILRSAPITVQKCHPDGSVMLAEVSLQFSEVVQTNVSDGVAIRYVSREDFERRGSTYRASLSAQRSAEAFVAG